MSAGAASSHLAQQARRLYADHVVAALPGLSSAVLETARGLLDKAAVPAVVLMRRDLFKALETAGIGWQRSIADGIYQALGQSLSVARAADLPAQGSGGLSLVDDDTIEREILTSRLALAVMDRASWEFSDLRSRLSSLEKRSELDAHDMVRAHVLARIVLDAWRTSGMSLDGWRELQAVLHDELAHITEEAYHEANRWLIEHRVLPEIDLRPLIRRSRGVSTGGMFSGALGANPSDHTSTSVRGNLSGGRGAVGDETRLMTRAGPLRRENSGEILSRLNKLVDPATNDGLPGFLIGNEDATESGHMIVQYTAAAIVNDLASRAHPASVYSIPTSANAEDHVSMGANEARHVLAMVEDLGKVLALELYTAAQALDLRRDMINAARDLADRADAEEFASKVQGGPLPDAADRAGFVAEVDGLRAELADADAFRPGRAVAAAHAAIRERIAFLHRDRAMDGEVAAAVRMVADGSVLAAARAALD